MINLKRNHATNVRPVKIAVGPELGPLRIGIIRYSDCLDDGWNKVECDSGNLEVDVKPLDDVCAGYGHNDVLMIDVEGFELQVLKGDIDVFACADCVLLECLSEYTTGFGFASDDLIPLTQCASFHGFRFSAAYDENSLMPLGDLQHTGALGNWVFVRQSALLGHSSKTSTSCQITI